MKKLSTLALALALCASAEAAWYWPFSSSDEKRPPRVSELLENASIMIDEAYDLASDGKTADAVEKYREALRELDRVEAANPDRVKTPEFNTLKNKRATVTAAIESLLLSEARDNARPISVTDTTELQKKYDEQLKARAAAKAEAAAKPRRQPGGAPAGASRARIKSATEKLKARDYAGAESELSAILSAQPDDAGALNLLAAVQASRGDLPAAEKTLDRAITAHPGSYHAYYNMARLNLRQTEKKNRKANARRYYEAGRQAGGPVDAVLEKGIK